MSNFNWLEGALYKLQEQLTYWDGALGKYPESLEGSREGAMEYLAEARRYWRAIERDVLKRYYVETGKRK